MVKSSIKMKDSGIEWIGEIPEHWGVRKLSHICETITDFTASGSFADLAANVKYLDTEDYARLIRTADLSGKREVKPVYINEHAYNYLNNSNLFGGEIILPNVGSIGEVYLYKPLYKRASLAPNSIMLRSFGSNEYLYYLFYTKQFGDFIKLESSSTAQGKFNKTQLRAFKIPHPPIEEQRLIAVQLNQICGMLDNTKADIENQIEILNEYKKSIITEVVTKGLDKNVELKDSGVFYVQPFNKNWELVKLGYICTALERVFHPEDTALICSNKGKVLIRPEEMRGAMMSTDSTMHGIHKGDIAIHGMDTWHGAIAVSDYDGKITKVVHVCKSEQDHRFIVYYLQQLAFNGVYKYISNGVRGNTSDFRSWNKVADIYITLPPIEEQKEIADYLDSKCSEIDSIIETKKQQLELLEEYKKSIIYEYVTGKRKVIAPIDGVIAPLDEVSAKPDFAVAQNTQSVSIESAGDLNHE